MDLLNKFSITLIIFSLGFSQGLEVSPSEISTILYTGGSDTEELTLSNTGPDTVYYQVSHEYLGGECELLAPEIVMCPLGEKSYSQDLSDVWGYSSPDGTELAIVGTFSGVSFVDVSTDPTNPTEVGFIAGPGSVWRDMKTWSHYAYLVTEGGGGVQIVDLEDPMNPQLVGTHTSFGNAHDIYIDEFGFAYVVGSSQAGGGLHILDLADPVNPVVVGSWSNHYIHDVFVRDNIAWCACIWDGKVHVVDVTDKSNTFTLASFSTTGNFTHNVWLTEDSQYALTTDEIVGGAVSIYDVSDLDNVNLVNTYVTNPNHIPHNVFVKGNYAYISAYADGMVMLDITDPTNPSVAYQYDTYPGDGGFVGAWGVYPYSDNGFIYISDIGNGLFVLGPSSQSWLSETPTAGALPPGGNDEVQVTLNATNMNIGEYEASITVQNSNSESPESVTVPILLTVLGAPNIVLPSDTLDFGVVFSGFGDITETLTIQNNGTGPLEVTSQTFDNETFSISPSSLTIDAGSSVDATVTLTASDPGDYSSTLSIESNDPDDGSVSMFVLATIGTDPPIIIVDPWIISDTLETGLTSNQMMTITNTGGADLLFNITAAQDETFFSGNIFPVYPNFTPHHLYPPYDHYMEQDIDYFDADGNYRTGTRCGTYTPTLDEMNATQSSVNEWLQSGQYERSRDMVIIPVAMHLVRYDDGSGGIDDSAIQAQIDVLNGAFLDQNFQFELVTTTITDNTAWSTHNYGTSEEVDMKTTLAVDPISTLNFYLCNVGGGLLGYATFPDMYPEDSPMHGVVCLTQSLPGGTTNNYNEGDTGTHEVGHYVGLYHTFQGGCAEPGDSVDDTPYVASPNFGCPEGVDSCPQEGADQIENFMDYTYDNCMNTFTPGQSERAHTLMALYRPTMYANTGASLESWLSIDPTEGTVGPGISIDVGVGFDAAGMNGGDYSANISVGSNDPSNPEVLVSLQLTVIGAPDVAVDISSIDFQSIFVNHTDTSGFVISNDGTDVLEVFSISVDNSVFSVLSSSATLAPGEEQGVQVVFSPTSTGDFSGIITLSTNDTDEETVSIPVSGSANEPPVIAVSVAALSDSLLTGETASHTFTISNDGNSDLDFTLAIQDEAARLRHAQINDLIEHSDNSDDYPMGMYPSSMGPAPLNGVPVSDSEEPADFSFLLEANGYSIEAANNFVTSFDLSTPGTLPNLGSNPAGSNFPGSGSFGKDDQSYYYIVDHTNNLWKLDTTLITAENLGTLSVDGGQGISGLATDPTDGTLYGVTTNCSSSNLVTLDPETGTVTTIGPTEIECAIALAINADGVFYTYDIKSDNMYTLNKTTGASSLLGSIGFDANYGQGMGYDSYTGQIYVAAYNNSAQAAELRVVDPETGGTTLIGGLGSSGNQLGFLTIPGEFVNWLTAEPADGTVTPGGSLTVTVNFDAEGMFGGDYSSDIVISSNDPSNPETSVNVQLNVTGAPDIAVDETSLSFAETFVGYSDSLELAIQNSGTDILSVTSITVDNDVFTLSHSSATIIAGETLMLGIDFIPTSADNYSGTITVVSDDTDQGTIMVSVSGSAIIAPVAGTDPTSFSLALESGDQNTALMTLSNTGGSNLNYSISTSSIRDETFVDINPSDEPGSIRRLFYSPPTSFNTEPNITLEYDNGVVTDGIYCGVAEPEQETLEQVRKSLDLWLATGGYQPDTRDTPLIPVAVHVIRYDDGSHDVEDSQVYEQIEVLSASLAGQNFQFELISIDRTDNTAWSTHTYGTSEENDMKGTLAIDPISTFNWYMCDLQGGLLGYATFPFMYPEDSYMHGVVLHSESLPGGSLDPAYTTGDVGVHEAGHYIGLYHTFQGGCVEPGDEVDDTPYSANPNWDCPEGLDTCPQEGEDPIHNYMSYNTGQCMDHFTPGQSERAHAQMSLYRPTMYANTSSSNWLSIDPASGSIAPDSTALTTLTITTENVYAGEYATNITVSSNDPENSEILIPFELSVTGVAEIDVVQDTLSYGNVYVESTETLDIQVSNVGTDVLYVTGWSIEGEGFSSTHASSFDVDPGLDEQISVNFTPSASGAYTGTFTLESDDEDEPSVSVLLEGTSTLPPSLNLSDTTISDTLAQGSSVSSSFLLANNGGVDLNFVIEIGGLENLAEDDFENGFGNYTDISDAGNGTSWETGEIGQIPPLTGLYVVANDDGAGSSAPATNILLASQVLNASGQMALVFDSYFPQPSGTCGTSSYSEEAKILVSIDGGDYSEIMVPSSSSWTETTIDLSSLSATGNTIQVVFNYDDCGGNWGYYWGFDNAQIQGVGGAEWLTLSPMEGSLPSGDVHNIEAVLSSEGNEPGDYSVNVHVRDVAYMIDETITFNMTVLEFINTPPASFALVYPANGETVANLEPTLQWDPAFDPDTMDNVYYTIDFGSTIPDQTTIDAGTDTSYSFEHPLENNTTYYWQMSANDEFGGSSESIGGWQTFTIDLGDEADGSPVITDISDIPNDQGGLVYITFNRSFYDTDTLRIESYQVERLDDSVWVGHSNYGAYGADSYTVEANTRQDSTESDPGITIFRIIANMDEGNWASDSAEGYSVDNLIPEIPSGFTGLSGNGYNRVSWNEIETEDFQYYSVYKNNSVLDYSVETEYIDDNGPFNVGDTYNVTATDFNGNESAPSVTALYDLYLMDIDTNWNLVGLALGIDNIVYTELFPGSQANSLYGFDGQYYNSDLLINGSGYWLFFNSDSDPVIYGFNLDELQINLSQGWNIISGITGTVPLSSVIDPENIIVPNTLYGFSELYFNSDEIVNGQGYWINASSDGVITLTNNASARTNITFSDRTLTANRISFNGMDLFFGVEIPDNELLSYSLPPQPPAGALDARFEGDLRVVEEHGEIKLMHTEENVSIEYSISIDAGEHMNWVLTSANGEENILDGTGEFIIAACDQFYLKRKEAIPLEFAIHQNYPNPFNPTTMLRYELPEYSFVTLTIYDMLGKEITTLVNDQQEAGYKSVRWDATDSMGKPVSAGVYLFQISVDNLSNQSQRRLVKTLKMVLLK